MSNPGVIILSSHNVKNGYFKRFQIEDNIGECIHIHIDSFRFDLSIEEFYKLCDIVRSAMDSLDIFPGYSISHFDERFLSRVMLESKTDVIKSIIKKTTVSKLKFIIRGNFLGLPYYSIVPIHKTPHYKFYNNNKDEYLSYKQHNYFEISNSERIKSASDFIEKNGYPYKKKYISIFAGQMIVRDGLHRSAYLASTSGIDSPISVLELQLNNKNFSALKATVGIYVEGFVCITKRIIKAIIKR